MRKDKEAAIEMRKAGKSYKEIRDLLRIPKSTLSDWFAEVDWSKEVRKRLTVAAEASSAIRIKELDRIRGVHLARLYKEAGQEAVQELEELKYNPLFVSGVMLYWGEGDKLTRSQVRFSNSDPEMIRFYVQFLRLACRVPESKIRASLLIYPDIEEQSNRRFWSFSAGLPLANFTKSILIQGRHKTKRLRYGVCNITVSSSYFKVKMLKWLELLPRELMNKQYYETMASVR